MSNHQQVAGTEMEDEDEQEQEQEQEQEHDAAAAAAHASNSASSSSSSSGIHHLAPKTKVQVGSRQLIFGANLRPMRDSTSLYREGRWAELRQRLHQDGFILVRFDVRGALSAETIKGARDAMLQHLQYRHALDPHAPVSEGKIGTAAAVEKRAKQIIAEARQRGEPVDSSDDERAKGDDSENDGEFDPNYVDGGRGRKTAPSRPSMAPTSSTKRKKGDGKSVAEAKAQSMKGSKAATSDPYGSSSSGKKAAADKEALVEGWTIDAQSGGVTGNRELHQPGILRSWKRLGRHPAVRAVYAGQNLYDFYRNIFAKSAAHGETRNWKFADELTEAERQEALVADGRYANAANTVDNATHPPHHSGKVLHVHPQHQDLRQQHPLKLHQWLTEPMPLPSCTWLRMKGRTELTVQHIDYYYFRNTTSIFSDNRADRHVAKQQRKERKRLTQPNNASAAGSSSASVDQPSARPKAGGQKRRREAENSTDASSNNSSTAFPGEHYDFKLPTESSDDECEEEKDVAEPCMVCKQFSEDDDDSTLLCDLCDSPCHMSCATPKITEVPHGEWHCEKCANAPFELYTCWIPLGEIKSANNGVLCVVPGSQHMLRDFHTPMKDYPLPKQYTKIEKKLKWEMPEYMNPGDVILFNIKTVHGATKNTSYSFRLSCDTRVAAQRFIPPQLLAPSATKGTATTGKRNARKAASTSEPTRMEVEEAAASPLPAAAASSAQPPAAPAAVVHPARPSQRSRRFDDAETVVQHSIASSSTAARSTANTRSSPGRATKRQKREE